MSDDAALTPGPRLLSATERWQWHADAPLAGILRARRSGRILAADTAGRLTLLEPTGEPVRAAGLGSKPRSLAASSAGTTWAALSTDGSLAVFGKDLEPRWTRGDLREARSLAIRSSDSLLAIGMADGSVEFHDRRGRPIARVAVGLPPVSMSLGTSRWGLVCTSAFGDVAAFDARFQLAWRLQFRCMTGPLEECEPAGVVFLPAGAGGVQALDSEGNSAGVYEPPEPADLVAVSPEGSRLLVAGHRGGLYVLSREEGWCLWRSEEPAPALGVALGPEGRSGYVATADGRVRALRFLSPREGGEEARGRFLELRPRVSMIAALEPLWTLKLPVLGNGRFPGRVRLGTVPRHVLVLVENEARLLRITGGEARRDRLGGKGLLADFGNAGAAYAVATPSALHLFDIARGETGTHRGAVVSLALPSAAPDAFVADEGGEVVRIGEDGRALWSRAMPAGVSYLASDPGGDLLAVACEDGNFYLLDRSGVPGWKRRRRGRGEFVLLLPGRAVFADPSGEVSLYGLDRQVRWTRQTGLALDRAFEERGVPFLHTKDNRFYRLLEDGSLQPVDRADNLGSSRLLRTGDAWLEVNVHSSLFSVFDLAGVLRARFTAPAAIDAWNLHTAGSFACFTAGDLLFVFDLSGGAEGSGAGSGERRLEMAPPEGP